MQQQKQSSPAQGKQVRQIFDNRFEIKKKISAGSFGVVYACIDLHSKDLVALKIEKAESENLMSLDREIQVLEELQGLSGIPKLYWYGHENGSNQMALQLLGRDMSYHLKNHRKFTLKCVVNIAVQLILILESIHNKISRGVIHRDIKPENILTGRDLEANLIYLVDFGISKIFKDSNGHHMQFSENKPFIGTTRYASIAAHNGHELSRKDDLESLGYVLIFFLKGNLPWQNIPTSSDKEKAKMVGSLKIKLESSELCQNLPSEFQRYFDYVKKLGFKQQPDYKHILTLFDKMSQKHGFSIDKKFDWTEQGTTTTKSSDTQNHRNSHVDSKSGQKSEKRGLSQKSSFNDLPSSLFGNDLLKPSDRRKSRQKSGNDSQYSNGVNSQQSSIFNNYQPSVIQHHKIQGFKKRKTGGSNYQKNESKLTIGNSIKMLQLNEGNDLFKKGQDFQDLEVFESKQNNNFQNIPVSNENILKVSRRSWKQLDEDFEAPEDEVSGLSSKFNQLNIFNPQKYGNKSDYFQTLQRKIIKKVKSS